MGLWVQVPPRARLRCRATSETPEPTVWGFSCGFVSEVGGCGWGQSSAACGKTKTPEQHPPPSRLDKGASDSPGFGVAKCQLDGFMPT